MDRSKRRERWKRRRQLQARPLIHLVPNAFTVASICFGLSAIRYGLDGRYETAVVMIILAGIFDGLDGRSARLLKITSKLGAELDSLADFLSFGVAPAFLIYLWSLNEVKGLGWAIALFYVICAALRLARFNSELEDPDRPPWMTRFFTGMPAPAAAGVVSGADDAELCARTNLAVGLGAKRVGGDYHSTDDGKLGQDLLDQDGDHSHPAGISAADAGRHRRDHRSARERALVDAAHGRLHLSRKPAHRDHYRGPACR